MYQSRPRCPWHLAWLDILLVFLKGDSISQGPFHKGWQNLTRHVWHVQCARCPPMRRPPVLERALTSSAHHRFRCRSWILNILLISIICASFIMIQSSVHDLLFKKNSWLTMWTRPLMPPYLRHSIPYMSVLETLTFLDSCELEVQGKLTFFILPLMCVLIDRFWRSKMLRVL